jgi:hypothetical protein
MIAMIRNVTAQDSIFTSQRIRPPKYLNGWRRYVACATYLRVYVLTTRTAATATAATCAAGAATRAAASGGAAAARATAATTARAAGWLARGARGGRRRGGAAARAACARRPARGVIPLAGGYADTQQRCKKYCCPSGLFTHVTLLIDKLKMPYTSLLLGRCDKTKSRAVASRKGQTK